MLARLLIIAILAQLASACEESVLCDAGYEKPYPKCNETCVPCPDGRFRNGILTHCKDFTRCIDKYMTVKTEGNSTHDRECECSEGPYLILYEGTCYHTCRPGEEFNKDQLLCVPCRNNTFKSEEGPGPCKNCSVCNKTEFECNATHNTSCVSTQPGSEASQALDGGKIVLIVIAVTLPVLLVIFLLAVYFCCWKKKQKSSSRSENGSSTKACSPEAEFLMRQGSHHTQSAPIEDSRPEGELHTPNDSVENSLAEVRIQNAADSKENSATQEGLQKPADHKENSQTQRGLQKPADSTENSQTEGGLHKPVDHKENSLAEEGLHKASDHFVPAEVPTGLQHTDDDLRDSLQTSKAGSLPVDTDTSLCTWPVEEHRPRPLPPDDVTGHSSHPSARNLSTGSQPSLIDIRPDVPPRGHESADAGTLQEAHDWEYESNIKDNFPAILQRGRADDFLLASLVQGRVISLPQNEDIRLKREKEGHRAAIQALIPVLRTHRKKGFEAFIKALVNEHSRQDDLALTVHRELAEQYIMERDQGTGDEGDGRAPQADERQDSVDLTQPRGSETERKKIVEGKNSRETPLKKIDGEQNPSETRLKEVDTEQNPIETPLKEIDDTSNLDETDLKDSPVNPNLTKVKEL